MRRILFILALCLLSSCERDGDVVRVPACYTHISAILEPASRTYIEKMKSKKWPVKWSEGDSIYVNGLVSEAAIIASDARRADFLLPKGVELPYCGVYPPLVAGAFRSSDLSASINLPSVQHYVPGTFDPAAALMLSYSEDGVLAFSPAMSYLRLVVRTSMPGISNVKSVRLRCPGEENLSGPFTASFYPELSIRSSSDACCRSLTFDCGDGASIGESLFIALPPGFYSNGLDLLVVCDDGICQDFELSNAVYLYAGKVYDLELNFAGGLQWGGPGIYSVTDWHGYALSYLQDDNLSDFMNSRGEVNLYADLYTKGRLTRMKTAVTYPFLGNGHSLTRDDSIVPLFTAIADGGQVRDLVLKGYITKVNTAKYGSAQLSYEVRSGALVENVRLDMLVKMSATAENMKSLFGLVAVNSGTIRNCSSAVVWPVTPKTSDWVVAPIACTNKSGALIENCLNEGNILLRGVAGYSGIAAGICFENLGTVRGCTNLGRISVNGIGVGAAGICAWNGGSLENCTNGSTGDPTAGTIAVSDASLRAALSANGGMCVYMTSQSSSSAGSSSGCVNHASITTP